MSTIKKAYDHWSEIYDTNDNKTRDLDQKITQIVLGPLSFNQVLEIGCGTGKNTQWLASQAKSITALDGSEGMLEKAKEKVQSQHVEFKLSDLTQKWNVENEAFDLISCNLVLEHIKDFNHIFNEANKKLKSDGLFFICELHPFKQYAGTQARFETNTGTHLVDAYLHHTSEYMETANANGFELISLKEWFDDDNQSGLPRLISFIFKKQ